MKRYLIAILILIIGVGLILYPQISIRLYENQSGHEIISHNDLIDKMDEETVQKYLNEAKAYNDSLSGNPVQDPFLAGTGIQIPSNYHEVLKFEDGIIATVEIPKIDLSLPIYHGTTETVLQKGIGHMEGTSFTIGGIGNHSVITGHTGLAHAKMFTDLTSVELGDIIFIKILGKTLAYEVEKISVVLPDDLSILKTKSKEDLLSLITCTPFGINSHRLVVTASRIEYSEDLVENIKPIKGKSEADRTLTRAIVSSSIIVTITLGIVYFRKKKKKT